MNDSIKTLIKSQWKKNGIDASQGFFSLFSLDINKDADDIQKLIREYYGGIENVIKRLNKLTNKKIHIDDGGYDYDFIFTSFNPGGYDYTLFANAEVDGDGEVDIISEEETFSIYDAVNNEDWGWEVKSEITDSINGWLFTNITEKFGIVVEVDELFIIP